MAEQRRTGDDFVDIPKPGETGDTEHERARTTNDRDKAVGGNTSEDIDPDSAGSLVDRDDSVTD